MKQQVTLVIAALMITSMAFAISTTSVSATDGPTVGIDEDLVMSDTPMVRIITITNAGPDAINTVRIILPVGFDSEFIAPLVKLSEDDIAYLDAEDTNVVILPAGTLIRLGMGATLTVPENTPVIIENGVDIDWMPVGAEIQSAMLIENLKAKTKDEFPVITLANDENFETAESNEETLTLGSAIFTTTPVTVPTKITVTAPDEAATFNAGLYDATTDEELVPPVASSGGVGVVDTVEISYPYVAENNYKVKITDATEDGDYNLSDDGIPQGSGAITIDVITSPDGIATFATTPGITAPETITVTAPTDTATFTAGLYDATTGEVLVEPQASLNESEIKDTVNISHTYVAENDYVVKITVANEVGDYTLSDDGTPKGSGTIEVTGNLVRLTADTMAIRIDGSDVILPEKTLVQLVTGTTFEMMGVENITTVDEVDISGFAVGPFFVATADATTNLLYRVTSGKDVTVTSVADGDVVIPAGAVLEAITGIATLFDNTDVYRENGRTLTLDTETEPENLPKDWTQDNGPSDVPSGTYVEWTGELAKGAPLEFPFALTTPAEAEDYTIYVRTIDAKGAIEQTTITLTVDNAEPEIKVSVSPEIVKGNTKVTITVESNEPLAEIENVLVAENMAPENTEATFKSVSTDKMTWTYTYTTSDNAKRDGTANVCVVSAKDLAGLENTESGTFIVDRVVPLIPEIEGFPKTQTNKGAWLLQGTAKDNDGNAGENIAEGTVEIRVGTAVNEVTTDKNGYWSYSITLTEGVQEVGVRCVDLAGNVGPENAENSTYDATPPSISITSPENGAYINDNTPTIRLTISDAVMGIENTDLYSENFGYSVQLCYDDGDPYGEDNLTPKIYPTEDQFKSFTFENDWSEELAENWYRIYVVAGDNLQQENVYFRFNVDVTAPTVQSPTEAENPLSNTTVAGPYVQKSTTLILSGTCLTDEVGATLSVYLNDATTAVATATVDSANRWTVNISLTAGTTTKVEVTLTDVAGNEGARQLYGYTMADGTAPTVTLITLPETTDKSSITISGTVSKDTWEDWSDITLTVQVGTGSVEVPCVGGSYEYSLSLAEGPNTIVVQAIDGIGNASAVASETVERTVTPWGIYAVILVIIALILAAIAIFAGPKIWKR